MDETSSTSPPSCPLCDEDHQRGSTDCPARRIGSVVGGQYRIERLLGAGGMGVVYEAVTEREARRVALKMLLPKHRNNPEIIIRFQREAERAMALDHVGIVRVARLGLHDERDPYFEMELLRGGPLRAPDDGEPLDPVRVARLFVQVLDALASAHAHGLVHRDLKPENIFLLEGTDTTGAHERVKILDFGIAKATAPSMALTVSGKILGTPYYMSPEQATGSRSLDARSDLYSVGASMFQVLTGRYPVEGESFTEILARLAQGRIRRHPREFRPGVPAWLDAIVARAMSLEPADRFANAPAMKRALEQGLSRGDAASTRPARVPLIIALVLLAGSVAVAMGLHRRRDDCAPAAHASVRSVGGRCVLACATGRGDCDGDAANGCETDLRASDVACGRCGAVCALEHAASACVAGACALQGCATGFGDCDHDAHNGCEVDLAGDALHCGRCGPDAACALRPWSTAVCAAGQCGFACAAHRGDCDGDVVDGCETDLAVDGLHCGACGVACAMDQTCRAGACVLSSCPAGRGDCAGRGACDTDLARAVDDCGQCGHACRAPHAVDTCVRGRCGFARCAPGFADCDHHAGNGCEADVATDARACGACGAVCAPANAVGRCADGACAIASCAAGALDCDHQAGNGCEATPASDARNCGACGRACTATQVCAAGACACAPGAHDCGGGRCAECCGDSDCAAHRACGAGGRCSACAAGFADCDHDASNGCETDVTASESSCGACGAACTPARAEGACIRGVCRVTSCAQGFADCDHAAANGCEAELASDARHCGACGRVCGSAMVCASGACACAPGAHDCGAARCAECCGDADCGAHRRCRTDGRCSGCDEGFADCDAVATNGCETATAANAQNCGACGVACGPGQTCSQGHCGGE